MGRRTVIAMPYVYFFPLPFAYPTAYAWGVAARTMVSFHRLFSVFWSVSSCCIYSVVSMSSD
ncbi:hypothetical protein EDB87DRAFT_1639179 [Lactarius vividus]|nr:hypothetical protein EDB87DRAFT_1639179 [Lactarius vividus]